MKRGYIADYKGMDMTDTVITTETVTDAVSRLDLGCGTKKMAGFHGVDEIGFPGVDTIYDLRNPWIWKDESISEVYSSHFIEHLTGIERVHFFNELYRVLKPGAQARIITPHWSHERAYGDPTHQWPPVCSWTYHYLNQEWRIKNAPHTGYCCNFAYNLSGAFDPADDFIKDITQNVKFQRMTRNINTTTDLIALLTKL
jgi:hypothetical protein